MALFVVLLVLVLACGVSGHCLINYPYAFAEGIVGTLKWVGIAFLVVLFVAICA